MTIVSELSFLHWKSKLKNVGGTVKTCFYSVEMFKAV